MQAIFYLLHLLRPFRCQVDAQWGAFQEEAHAVAVVDLNPDRAGLAIAAATAEVSDKLLAVLPDNCNVFIGQRRRILLETDELVQFAFPLYAPDRHNIFEHVKECVGRRGTGDEPTGKSLHRYEAHVGLHTEPYKRHVIAVGEVGEGKLQGLVQTAVNGLLCNRQTVVGDADVEDFPLFFRL